MDARVPLSAQRGPICLLVGAELRTQTMEAAADGYSATADWPAAVWTRAGPLISFLAVSSLPEGSGQLHLSAGSRGQAGCQGLFHCEGLSLARCRAWNDKRDVRVGTLSS